MVVIPKMPELLVVGLAVPVEIWYRLDAWPELLIPSVDCVDMAKLAVSESEL